MVRRQFVVWLLSFTLLLGASWQPVQAKTKIAVTDAAGRTVMVAAPAGRAVVLFNYEEFLATVGPRAFDRVVGFSKTVWYDWRRSIWNKYVAAIPRIGQVPDVGLAIDGTFSAEKVIALRPDVVIMPLLDEPTSALDLRHQLEILGLIRRIVAERQATALVALHDLNLAARFADRLVLLADGRVYAAGQPAEVLTERTIRDAYGVEAEVARRTDGLTSITPVRPVPA